MKSNPGDDPITLEAYFPVPQDRAFQSWTDPEVVMKWFGRSPNSLHSAAIDLRPGGSWRFVKSDNGERMMGFEGQYIAIEPFERLNFTWSQFVSFANGERKASPFSYVEVSFRPTEKGTYIKLVHSAIHSDEQCAGFGAGWELAFVNIQLFFKSEVTA